MIFRADIMLWHYSDLKKMTFILDFYLKYHVRLLPAYNLAALKNVAKFVLIEANPLTLLKAL